MASPVPTTPPLVSVDAFHGISWAGFALCVIVFTCRIGIRVSCFGRLFVEDYLMLVALCLLLATTILTQLFVKYIYAMVDVSNGAMPAPSFLHDTEKGLRSFGTLMLLNYLGIWMVKLNFLLFFRRLGNHVRLYRIFWWIVLTFNVAAGVIVIGLIDFKCLMQPAEIIFATCKSLSSVMGSYTASKVSCALDAVSDGLIIVFPFSILWGCKLSLRKKLALSGIFGLVAFTIAVTIIRGSIFGGVYLSISEHNMKQLNITWIWFWFNVEFIVAFTIGCLVSFRTLFTQRQNNAREVRARNYQHMAKNSSRGKPKGLRAKARAWHDDLVTTFMTWEDTTRVTNGEVSLLPTFPAATGHLGIDFEGSHGWEIHPKSGSIRSDSMQGLTVRDSTSQGRNSGFSGHV
ncbi:putative glycoside hydrolase family 31 [Seiridium cardinale]